MNVIIATDGSDGAIAAARAAFELLRPDAEVLLVAVIPDRVDPLEEAGGIEGPVLTEEEADQQWQAAVAAGSGALARTAQAVEPVVRTVLLPSSEPAGRALVQLATEQQPDVLILGSERPGFFQRVFGSSVTDQVVHHAPCPVLVVPDRASH
ncbi:MAG: hypothetical protein JWM05_635 [Acidimicrobiales bacterium]|nr:hypothetical protein [Acidimicrobiales bacterium]